MVVNDISNWTLRLFPEVSFTPIVILALYPVHLLNEAAGTMENVLLLLEADGEPFICTQVLKLFLDT